MPAPRLDPACQILRICARTYQRWMADDGPVRVDGRPEAVRPSPAHALSCEERQAVLDLCNRQENAALPPSQIVPKLADEGEYIASESTFYRILREEGQQTASWSSQGPPQIHGRRRRTARRQRTRFGCWDITWLPGPIRGQFFLLYLIMDLFSRKIVGWEVHDSESAVYSRELVQRTVWKEKIIGQPLVLHGDNGSPLKGWTVQALLARLGITPSYSRPRVSDDNAFVEALFPHLQVRAELSAKGFESLSSARAWVAEFEDYYNEHHKHRGIQYVTPGQRHRGEDQAILERRHHVYLAAQARNPKRWSGATRNWGHTSVTCG